MDESYETGGGSVDQTNDEENEDDDDDLDLTGVNAMLETSFGDQHDEDEQEG